MSPTIEQLETRRGEIQKALRSLLGARRALAEAAAVDVINFLPVEVALDELGRVERAIEAYQHALSLLDAQMAGALTEETNE